MIVRITITIIRKMKPEFVLLLDLETERFWLITLDETFALAVFNLFLQLVFIVLAAEEILIPTEGAVHVVPLEFSL